MILNSKLKPLIHQSVLDIIDYDMHTRMEMEQYSRVLDCGVMSYLKSGEAMIKIKDTEYIQRPGDAVFIPPGLMHDHIKTSREDAVFIWWHFKLATNYGLDILSLLRLPVLVQMKNAQDFEDAFKKFMNAIKNENNIADFIYKNAKAMEVLACIFNSFLNSPQARITTGVPDIFFDIMEGITREPRADMSLLKLSEKYHMHATYISNKFKDYFGVSPIVLQRQLLFKKAKNLLIGTNKNISIISDELGFSELSVFSRFFSERAGMSPCQYRNTSF